jgi:hypothetical protein
MITTCKNNKLNTSVLHEFSLIRITVDEKQVLIKAYNIKKYSDIRAGIQAFLK